MSRARGLAIKATAPLLREAGGGTIVNISSATVMSGSPYYPFPSRGYSFRALF
jgi:hypothetical protein